MVKKITAVRAYHFGMQGKIHRRNLQNHYLSARQRGFSLIELMVGIVVGLLVVAVAGGALMVSRGVSGTVSDASALQQQASYAFRVIGQQLRQSGSLFLNLDPNNVGNTTSATEVSTSPYALPVAIETKRVGANNSFDPHQVSNSLTGTNTVVIAGYRRYQENAYQPTAATPALQSQSRDCMGGPSDDVTNAGFARFQSTFSLSADGSLLCTGTVSATAQPIIGNVASFRLRYLVLGDGGTGNPTVRYVNAGADGSGISNWAQVTGVEVCLVLFGNERMDIPSPTNYTDCDGTTTVDMSKATATDMSGSAIGAARAGRMHMVFRNIYQLRSQGLIGSVL